MSDIEILQRESGTIITDGSPDSRIMKCLVPIQHNPQNIVRMADSASFLHNGRMAINISVSNGCVGRCARVCPSGLPKTLKPPMFSAEEMVHQVEEHLRLRSGHINESTHVDVGTFADGEPASNGIEVLRAVHMMLKHRNPRIDHVGVSTIGFRYEDFLPAFLEAARQHSPGRLRLHYSFYGPGEIHDAFIPRPAPPMEDVFPMLVTVGRASGHRVTLNIPMIVGHTDTLQNMERTALYVKPYSDAMRIKLSSFNPSYDADGGAEHLEPSSAEHVRECAEYLRQQKLEVKIFTADTQSDGSKIEAGCGRLNIMTRAKIGSAMS